jgi:hypothetical protein
VYQDYYTLLFVVYIDHLNIIEFFFDVMDYAYPFSIIKLYKKKPFFIKQSSFTLSNSCGVACNSCKPFLKCFRHSLAYWPRPIPYNQLTICSVCQRANVVSNGLN